MFRTKTDVDNHVRATFRNIKLESERNLRGYNVAKLYLGVGDYDSTLHYISTYLSVRPDSAVAHKILGQAYEGLKEKEKALAAYKRSLELESKQPDLVLKVCELLLQTNPYLTPGVAQYWIERAELIQPHHPVVFALKAHLLSAKGEGKAKSEDLESLIKKELEARPKDVSLNIQLLKLFMETNRKDIAYKHAMDLEAKGVFRKELSWYKCIVDIMKAYKEEKPSCTKEPEFYVNKVAALLQQVALSTSQETHELLPESALTELDETLHEAGHLLSSQFDRILQVCVDHGSIMLAMHFAITLLRKGKQSRLGCKEYVKLAQPLLMFAAMPKADFAPVITKRESIRKLLQRWETERAYCCSQAGHVLLAMAKDGGKQFLDRVHQLCSPGWKEKVHQRIFTGAARRDSSQFLQYERFDVIPDSLPTISTLSANDKLSQQLYPESLHHFVWLGLQNLATPCEKPNGGMDHGLESSLSGFRLSRDFSCTVFETLQPSAGNVKFSSSESLSRLDVDAFLYATVFCAASSLKRQREKGFVNEDFPSVLPADITDPLCSREQARWWSVAWQMFTNNTTASFGDVRAIIQRGLEVVRVLGNHGMDVKLMVLLAKTFEANATYLLAEEENSEGAQLEARAHLYWSSALGLLERMDKNEIIHLAEKRLFRFEGNELSRTDVKALLEDGRFFLARRLMRAEQFEEAVLAFNQLKSPYASFYQAVIYKKMADDLLSEVKSENITSDMRSKHSILLLKARSALHLTLDRLRAPQMNPKHPLNTELGQLLDDVEAQLAHIEFTTMNRNACDGTSDDSVSSHHSAEDHHRPSSSSIMYVQNGRSPKSFQCSTPNRSRRHADRTITEKQEARPSPERLDAQLRRLATTNDTLLQSVLEQNRAILASNKGILEALEKNQQVVQDMQNDIASLRDEMAKLKVEEEQANKPLLDEIQNQFAEIRQEIAKLKISDIRANLARVDEKDEDLYVFGDDEAVEELCSTSPQLNAFQQYPPTYQNPYAGSLNGAVAANLRRNMYPASQPLVQSVLPPNVFQHAQVPVGVGRNVDPTGMLYSPNLMPCYTGLSNTLGLPFDGLQQGAQAQQQVSDYSSAPTLVSLLYGNQQAAQQQQPQPQPPQQVPAGVVRPQFSQLQPNMNFIRNMGIQQTLLRPSTLVPTNLPNTVSDLRSQSSDVINSGSTDGASSAAPHNFQISMPAQATIPSAASLEKNLSPLQPVTTSSLLRDVPSPVYSAITPTSLSPKTSPSAPSTVDHRAARASICSEDGSYVEETECEGADFKPVIPLPNEITVTTGEEGETVLFDERAKLYRYVEGEWKERGVGQMKVLQNPETGKSRIVMRREQVHKVCANHQITADIELKKHSSSENSLIWVAQDFAEEVVQLEKFCIRFKTAQQADEFKNVCENARLSSLANATPTKSLQPTVSSTPSIATPTKSLQPTVSSSPSIATTPASSVTATMTPTVTQSPFGAFFQGSLNSSIFSTPVQTKPADSTSSNVGSKTPIGDDSYTEDGDYNPGGNFTPLIPLPDEVAVVTGEENETPLFCNRAKLYRYTAASREWKERGVGDIKILKHNETGQVRLVMRREQIHKVCANHFITPDMELTQRSDNKDRYMWCAQDFAEGQVQTETFVVKFKTTDEADRFKKAFDEARELSKIAKTPTKSEAPATSTAPSSSADATKPTTTSVFGQPATLGASLTASGGKVTFGGFNFTEKPVLKPSEETPKAETTADAAQVKPNPFLKFSFAQSPVFGSKGASMPSFASLASAGQTSNDSKEAATEKTTTQKAVDNSQRPLSEMFKPKEGSWSCSTCYASNTADSSKCVCCETTKPGCEAAKNVALKSKVDLSTGGQTFNFGITPASKTEATSNSFMTSTQKITDGSQRPLSEMFKPKEGSWSCPACYASNTADNLKCVCCETTKPGCETAKTGTLTSKVDLSTGGQTFKFGITPGTKSESSSKSSTLPGFAPSAVASTGTFTFGVPQPTEQTPSEKFKQPEVSTPSFSFGVPKGDTSSPRDNPKDAGFVFGASLTSNKSIFSGTGVTTEQNSSATNPTFAFGSSDNFRFTFDGVEPEKSPAKDHTSGEEYENETDEEGDHLQFKPVIPLPAKVDVITGEENETVLFSHHAKLYRFSDKEWKERGIGDIKILKHNDDGRLRLVMRRNQVLKICLNHFLTPDIQFKEKDPKSLTWSAPDFSDGEVTNSLFAVRFKSADLATQFKEAIEEALIEYSSPSTKSIPDDEKVTKTSGAVRELFKDSDNTSSCDDEVEIVYEATVTPEERDKALRLQLPANFYNYRRAPPCSGCAGCEDDSDQSDKAVDEQDQSSTDLASQSTSSVPKATEGSVEVSSTTETAPSFWNATSPSKPVNFTFGSSFFSSQSSPASIFGGKGQSSIFGGTPSTQPSATSVFGGTPSTQPSATSVFGGTPSTQPSATSVFGGTPSTQPSATSVFGGTPSIFGSTPAAQPSATSVFGGTPSTQPSATPIFGGTPTAQPSATPIFGGTPTAQPSAKVVFGGTPTAQPSATSIFSGTPTAQPSAKVVFGGTPTAQPSATSVFGSKSLFGGTPSSEVAAAPVFGTPTSGSVFGGKSSTTGIEPISFLSPAVTKPETTGLSSTTQTSFGGGDNTAAAAGSAPVIKNVFGTASPAFRTAAPAFGTAAPAFGTAAPVFGTAAPVFGSASQGEDNESKETEKDTISFLPVDNSLSFAALAQSNSGATTNVLIAASEDSNKGFQFAGAGSQVFGKGTALKSDARKAKDVSSSKAAGDSSGDEGEDENDDSHDPQFKPIIPLPDAIEVRTGEEEEEKKFCERAKLFRFTDKQWKERGVGEMKILYHPQRKTYRLLLRREIVHKVVLNQPLSEDLELQPLQASNTSWCWGGMNYAEDPEGEVEKLAVRFKDVKQADEFKRILFACQEELKLNTSSSAVNESGAEAAHSEVGENIDKDELAYDVDPSVGVYGFIEEAGILHEKDEGTWKALGEATVCLIFDHPSILVKQDNEIICQTTYTDEDSYMVSDNCFEWTAFDLEEKAHRTFRIYMSTPESALEFKTQVDAVIHVEEGGVTASWHQRDSSNYCYYED